MYNRYIPQPDGSYRKNRMPDRSQNARPIQRPVQKQAPPCQEPEIPCDPPPQHNCQPPVHTGAGDFLRRLLPKNLDTGDLLIILLLLLMAGDSKDDQNTALLTLALYFFL